MQVLLELMRAAPNPRRAAMYGLAAAGDAAVPGLIGLLRALLAAPDHDQVAQHTTVMAMMALGEAALAMGGTVIKIVQAPIGTC